MGAAPTGMGRDRTYPATAARHLLNPLRNLVQPASRIVRRMGLRSHDRVLELGCGPGWFSPSLSAAVPQGRVVLCDLQPGMLEMAARRTAGFANVETVRSDCASLPFADNSFDAVLLATVLGEVPDAESCMREVHRVLRPGGVLTVVETRRDSDFIRRSALFGLARSAGFTPERTWGMPWEYTARLRVPAPDVRLVTVTRDDIDWITRACQDPDIQRWTTVPHPYTRDHAVWFVDNPREEVRRWAIRTAENDEPVGMISIHAVNAETGIADIGYWVAPWGRRMGVARAAVGRVVEEIRGLGTAKSVEARVAVTNTASRRTVESCGFVPTEDAAGVRCPDGGGEVDAVVYRLAL